MDAPRSAVGGGGGILNPRQGVPKKPTGRPTGGTFVEGLEPSPGFRQHPAHGERENIRLLNDWTW